MAGSNLGRTNTLGGRQITEEKVLSLLCHLQKDKEKKPFALYGRSLSSHENCETFFYCSSHLPTTGKNVETELIIELLQYKRNKAVQQRNLINIKLT